MNPEIIITYKKVKYLRMKIRNGKVLVTVPFFTSKEKVNEFIKNNQAFIDKYLPAQQARMENKIIHFNDEITILGKNYQVLPTSLNEKVTEHYIFIKDNEDLRKSIKKLFKKEQFEYFTSLTRHYYDIMQLDIPFPKIVIKDVKSKWGSYSRKNNVIEYASEVIFKNPEVYDYLIVHELCHMKEFNHSAKFYALVGKYCPNYKDLRNKLKKE